MAKGKNPKQSSVEERIARLEEKWKRALADYANLEKRVERERGALARLASAQLLDKVLPILDELEVCQEHLKDEGLKIVLDKFLKVLESEGVEEIKVEGKKFEPETMDAVEIIKGVKNRAIEVVLKGYRLDDRVLRPAKVKVGKGK